MSHNLVFDLNLLVFFSCIYNRGSMRSGETRNFYCPQHSRERFVYVALRGRNYLTLCEVEVYTVTIRAATPPGMLQRALRTLICARAHCLCSKTSLRIWLRYLVYAYSKVVCSLYMCAFILRPAVCLPLILTSVLMHSKLSLCHTSLYFSLLHSKYLISCFNSKDELKCDFVKARLINSTAQKL